MCSLLVETFSYSHYDWGSENRSLYRGLRYIEVRQIQVPLQLSAFLRDIKNNHNIVDGVWREGGGGGGGFEELFQKTCVRVSAPHRLRMALVRIICWAAVRKHFCCLMKYLQCNDDKYCTDSIYFLFGGVLAYWWARVLQISSNRDHRVRIFLLQQPFSFLFFVENITTTTKDSLCLWLD